jgi:8-oxo-dGTP pyrophosphatase MutT (NUDIX family)
MNGMDQWQNIITEALKSDLPGSESHKKMLPPERDLVLPSASDPDLKSSGVLILVYPDGNELFVCLIKRQPFLKYHAGQIGFPGGRMEKKDISLTDTALRETSEEIGIDKDQIRILGALSPLYVAVSCFIIHPFVAWYPVKPGFNIDHGEVEKIILLPLLESLKNPNIREMTLETITGWLKVPAFQYKGEIIWGATAMILSEFFDILRKGMQQAQSFDTRNSR